MKTMDEPDLRFEIDGPDDDGFVWMRSAPGQPIWGRNLGKYEDVAEKLCQWLGANDYGEDGLEPRFKPIKPMPTR